jgi:hypothetical protein
VEGALPDDQRQLKLRAFKLVLEVFLISRKPLFLKESRRLVEAIYTRKTLFLLRTKEPLSEKTAFGT